MCALIAMACYDSEGSGRTELTKKTLQNLLETVDFNRHRMFIIDNASCFETKDVIAKFAGNFHSTGSYPMEQLEVITNDENVGTAKAVNQGLRQRRPEEHCIKMDNDVVVYQQHWVDEMERAIELEPILRKNSIREISPSGDIEVITHIEKPKAYKIGILGLKRKDLGEFPQAKDAHFQTTLTMLPHRHGQPWVVFEEVKHGVMGTCTMFNWRLLDKIGYLHQPTLYGWDDGLISTRSKLAGFVNGFLPHIEIDHIDPGGTEYTEWKAQRATEASRLAGILNQEYIDGIRPIYEP